MAKARDQRFVEISRYLGLSEYEARVYVCLVTAGPSPARKLSMTSGVPRTKVYASLKKLIDRGLVSESPGNPRRYAASSPAKSFESALQQLKEETSRMTALLEESTMTVTLLERIYNRMQSTVALQKEEVWIVDGRSEALRKMREILSKAKKSVTVVASENSFTLLYKTEGKLLEKLVEKGVCVQIGTPIYSHSGTLLRELSYAFEIKHVDVVSPLLYISVDGKSFFLTNLESERNLGIVCSSPTLGDLFTLLLPSLAKQA